MIFEVADNLADNALGMLAKKRVEEIIVLPGAIVSRRERWGVGRIIRIAERRRRAVMIHHNFRMLLIEPGGNGVRRRPEDSFDSGLVQAI